MLSELLVGLSEPPANMTIARCDSVFGLLRGTFAARRTISPDALHPAVVTAI